MRKSVKRAFALASSLPVMTGSLLLAAPAAHAAIPFCAEGSEVYEFTLAGNIPFRAAVDPVNNTQTNICVMGPSEVNVVVVVKSGVNLTPPNITQTTGAGFCATRIIDMTTPVSLSLSVGASTTGPAICLGRDGTTTTLNFNAGSVTTIPDIEVWMPAYNYLLTWGYCYDYWLWYATNDSAAYDRWQDCYSSDRQIL